MPLAEVTTMDTILKLCPPLRCCHAIVCNKLSKKEYSDLHKMEGEAWENMKAQLVMEDDAGNVLPVTKHTFGKWVDDLEDEDDRLLDDVPENFRRFVQTAPRIKVYEIQFSICNASVQDYDEQVKCWEEENRRRREDKKNRAHVLRQEEESSKKKWDPE